VATKSCQVNEACENLRRLLAELKADPTEARLAAVAAELEQLEVTYRAAAVEEMTAALLSDEHAADVLVQVSRSGDAAQLDAQVITFKR